MSNLFDSVELAPRDPILGLNEQFNADTRPGKVNLGVGVYYDCLLYTSPSPRDVEESRMPSSA